MPYSEKDSFAHSPEYKSRRTLLLLGPAASGNISPKKRIENGEISAKEANKLADQLHQGRFHTQLENWQIIPKKCVDGRLRSDDQQELAPNSAGGSFTLVVADMLTHQDLRNYNGAEAEDFAQYAHNTFQFIKDSGHGHELGDHSAAHVDSEEASGCGAVDNLQEIYRRMVLHSESLYSIAGVLGVEVSSDTHNKIIGRAENLVEGEDLAFDSGSELMDVLRAEAGEESVEELKGGHKEVALCVNTRAGTTLDRAKVQEAFGDEYQAFNVDVWALQEAAKLMANGDEAKAQEKFAAMVYYNIATALVLCGKSVQLVTVK